MNEEEIINVISSLKICREFEQRNNIKLFTRKYNKVLSKLEKRMEKKEEVELKERVDNMERNIIKIDKKLDEIIDNKR